MRERGSRTFQKIAYGTTILGVSLTGIACGSQAVGLEPAVTPRTEITATPVTPGFELHPILRAAREILDINHIDRRDLQMFPRETEFRVKSILDLDGVFTLPRHTEDTRRFFIEIDKGTGINMPGIPGQTIKFVLPESVNPLYVETLDYPYDGASARERMGWIWVNYHGPITVEVTEGGDYSLTTLGPLAFQVWVDTSGGVPAIRDVAEIVLPNGQVYP